MSLQFLKPGLETSIQDSGRIGFMHQGIAQSGAMDPVAMQMANWLVSKPLDAPVIEITLIGPTIRFKSAMSIAICGAHFDCFLNDIKVGNDQNIKVEPDDILVFKKLRSGIRSYLAFTGELELEPVLGSYSTHLTANFGGFDGRCLDQGDILVIRDSTQLNARKIPKKYKLGFSGNYLLRCVDAVETDKFDKQQGKSFYSQPYKVTSESNRMGIRLKGESIPIENEMQIISSGLTQGSIQLTPSGQPIISSVDGQTIGGYPRIANVIAADLPILGQLKANDKVSFASIDKSLAITIYNDKQNTLDLLFRQ